MSSPALPSFISRRVLRGRYLFLSQDPPAATDLAVICAGWEDCAPEYEIQRDGFHYQALEYIVGGNWELKSPRGKWQIGPGAIFTYGPGISYSLKAVSPSGLSKYFVDFSGQSAGRQIARIGLKNARPEYIVQRRWLHDLLDQLIETSHLRRPARNIISKMLAPLILERVREDLHSGPRFSHAQQSYDQCRRYLADNYLQIQSLSQAACACGISAVHLSRLFQRFATESPNVFVVRMKMNHAAELIARSNLPVKEAAYSVGYEDPYHFSRVFKRVHGVAPSFFGKPSKTH